MNCFVKQFKKIIILFLLKIALKRYQHFLKRLRLEFKKMFNGSNDTSQIAFVYITLSAQFCDCYIEKVVCQKYINKIIQFLYYKADPM